MYYHEAHVACLRNFKSMCVWPKSKDENHDFSINSWTTETPIFRNVVQKGGGGKIGTNCVHAFFSSPTRLQFQMRFSKRRKLDLTIWSFELIFAPMFSFISCKKGETQWSCMQFTPVNFFLRRKKKDPKQVLSALFQRSNNRRILLIHAITVKR